MEQLMFSGAVVKVKIPYVNVNVLDVDMNEGNQLLDMNNHCLFEIISYLALDDLCSISLTCERLHSIAQQMFLMKPTNRRTDVQQLIYSFGSDFMQKLERYFQCFGHLLHHITLDLINTDYVPNAEFWPKKQLIFDIVTKYCCGGTLESFRGHRLTMKTSNARELIQMFSHLKKIRLENCDDITRVLSVSKECNDLQLLGWFWKNSDYNLNSFDFPKLESFSSRYISVSNGKYNDDCEHFLKRHTNLKRLKLHIFFKTDFNLNVIGELKDLEVLKLCYISDDDADFYDYSGYLEPTKLDSFCNLRKLKSLSVHSYAMDTLKFMLTSTAVESLEYLALSEISMQKMFCDGLTRFKKLRVLKLTKCDGFSKECVRQLGLDSIIHVIIEHPYNELSVDGLVNILEGFPQLKSIIIYDADYDIDCDHYHKLVTLCIRQNRRITVTLCETSIDKPSSDINYSNAVQISYKDSEEFIYRKPKKRFFGYTNFK